MTLVDDPHFKTVKGFKVKKKKSAMEKRLTKAEVDLLLGSITPETHKSYWVRNRAIILLLLNTGLRVNELAGLKVSDVLNLNGTIKALLDVRPEIAKRKKARQVPLNKTAQQAIKDLLEGREQASFTDALIVRSDGVALSKRSIQHIVSNTALKAGINRLVGCHALRHTCLSMLYEKTKNVKVVQTVAGHASSSLTMDLYTHTTLDGLTEAMSLLDVEESEGA